MMTREMGEPFYGTGKPPEGYKPGDYVEHFLIPTNDWCEVRNGFPGWFNTALYRLPADHPFYMPPIWCLDKAARDAGYAAWEVATWRSANPTRKSIIAHARTLQHGCEPMQEPVDPLVKALESVIAKWHKLDESDALNTFIADELRARFDITPKECTK